MATSVAPALDPLSDPLVARPRSLSPAALTDHDGDSILEDAAPDALPDAESTATTTTAASAPPAHPDAAADSAAAASPDLQPSGPICSFGPRLAYTYFARPVPRAEVLNALTPGRAAPASLPEEGVHWFSVDDQLVYLSFYQDYGPLNVGCLYRFCLHLHSLLNAPEHAHQRIFLYSSDEPDKKVNAALLLALYAMVVMRWPVADVLHPLSCLELQPYRDAGYSRADYHLHPQAILYGVHRALQHQLLDLSTFDLAAYEAAEKVETGDWNWITPGLVAFASPVEAGYTAGGGGSGGSAQGSGVGGSPRRGGTTGGAGPPGTKVNRAFRNVLDEFENKNVQVVVRLNKKLYDAAHFTSRGMEHVEMYFDDGTNPTLDMCRQFIDLTDRTISRGGAVAVHCKAGLGRTGTLIGAYLIYKHGFTADEAIGFMRLMRPGSCVGPQQHYLYENQLEWVRWAAQDALRVELAAQYGLAGVGPGAATGAAVAAAVATASGRARAGADDRGGGGGGSGDRRTTTPPPTGPAAAHDSSTTSPAAATTTTMTTTTAAAAPVTPRRTGTAVPGQPRKTPGRSRHAVAQPEEISPQERQRAEAEREEERMEGVVLHSSPRKGGPSDVGTATGKGRVASLLSMQPERATGSVDDDGVDDDDDGEEEDDDPLTLISPKKLQLAPAPNLAAAATKANPTVRGASSGSAGLPTTSRPKTPSTAAAATAPNTGTSTRPTRVPRPARPRSALADNRIVDRLGPTAQGTRMSTRAGQHAPPSPHHHHHHHHHPPAPISPTATASGAGAGSGLARSRAAKNLNTVLDAQQQQQQQQQRYSLRNAAARGGPGAGSQPLPPPPNSPTKLPQRVLGKRDTAPGSPVPATPTDSRYSHGGGASASASSSAESSRPGSVAPSKSGGGGGDFDPAAAATRLSAGSGRTGVATGGPLGGRNVRRRRSSMGSQETVNAG